MVRMPNDNRIWLPPDNVTVLTRVTMDASHASIGGGPGYNDREEGTSYDYVADRENSIFAYQNICEGLISAGIDVPIIDQTDYGFPLSNPSI
jgi:hypothetical protein